MRPKSYCHPAALPQSLPCVRADLCTIGPRRMPVPSRVRYPRVATTALFALTLLAGCAGSQGARPVDTPMPITSIESIKGKWAGVIDRTPTRGEDFIEVTISDDASYQITSARTAGAFQGKGKLTLRDGQAVAENPGVQSTYRLIDRGGK